MGWGQLCPRAGLARGRACTSQAFRKGTFWKALPKRSLGWGMWQLSGVGRVCAAAHEVLRLGLRRGLW